MPESSHCHVLWVENDEADRILVALCLEDLAAQAQVSFASDTYEALKLLTDRALDPIGAPAFDLVVLALNLSDGFGLDLLHMLRTVPDFPHVKVVIFSTCDDAANARVALGLGAFAYLIKPKHFAEFHAAVTSLLAMAASSASDPNAGLALEARFGRWVG